MVIRVSSLCAIAPTPLRDARMIETHSSGPQVIIMSPSRIAAIVLVVLGVLALAYGGFTYTSETHEASLGPLSVSVDEKERVNVPVWAGVGAIAIGGLLFFFGGGLRNRN
jgi:hypothetical protein